MRINGEEKSEHRVNSLLLQQLKLAVEHHHMPSLGPNVEASVGNQLYECSRYFFNSVNQSAYGINKIGQKCARVYVRGKGSP